jgi:hypothetical protein
MISIYSNPSYIIPQSTMDAYSLLSSNKILSPIQIYQQPNIRNHYLCLLQSIYNLWSYVIWCTNLLTNKSTTYYLIPQTQIYQLYIIVLTYKYIIYITYTIPGFKSLWIIPFLWRNTNAFKTYNIIFLISDSSIVVVLSITSNVVPYNLSMIRYMLLFAIRTYLLEFITLYNLTIFGCEHSYNKSDSLSCSKYLVIYGEKYITFTATTLSIYEL